MAKPENPGNGGNGNEGGGDEAGFVVLVDTEDDVEPLRFEGTKTITIADGGTLLVGKGPTAAFADGQWTRARVEPLVVAPIEP